MEDRNLAMARRIAERVAEAGGRTYFVGGIVRDWLLGLEVKDVDIEVHGIPVKALQALLDGLGERTEMGASFGVMGLRHYDIDIAMPRSETAVGRGHKDFEVIVDPFIGPERAAARRDFTINAMMRDVLTGEVLDFFGGREDLRLGRLRHVCDASFAEDPLRVFRAAQFAARFEFQLAGETAELCAGMDVGALASERVLGELEKALLKARRPSAFFQVLRRVGQLDVWFPELAALTGGAGEPDAWTEALRVLDEAARLRERAEHPLWLMLAALCQGLGGGAESLLGRLTGEQRLTQYVLNAVALLAPLEAAADRGADRSELMRLYDGAVCPGDLLLLARAAYLGRRAGQADRERLEAEYAPTEKLLRERLDEFRELMARPCVMGRDLVAAGVAPGPLLGGALARAHALRLDGASREEQLSGALDWLRRQGDNQGTGGMRG